MNWAKDNMQDAIKSQYQTQTENAALKTTLKAAMRDAE